MISRRREISRLSTRRAAVLFAGGDGVVVQRAESSLAVSTLAVLTPYRLFNVGIGRA